MDGINQLLLFGYVSQEPQIQTTKAKKKVLSLKIAINSIYFDKEHQRVNKTVFLSVTAWEKMAEYCEKNLAKGSLVFIEAKLGLKEREGSQYKEIEIIATKIRSLTKKDDSETKNQDEPIMEEKEIAKEEDEIESPF